MIQSVFWKIHIFRNDPQSYSLFVLIFQLKYISRQWQSFRHNECLGGFKQFCSCQMLQQRRNLMPGLPNIFAFEEKPNSCLVSLTSCFFEDAQESVCQECILVLPSDWNTLPLDVSPQHTFSHLLFPCSSLTFLKSICQTTLFKIGASVSCETLILPFKIIPVITYPFLKPHYLCICWFCFYHSPTI